MTGPEHVDNRMSGDNFGSVVQAGAVGDVIINHTAPRSGAVDRRLLSVLRSTTTALWLGPAARTAFTVAPGRLVSYGTDVLFRDGGAERGGPCLCGAVEPGDELWALGYPRGDESDATVVGLRCPAVLGEDHAVPQRLEPVFGKPGIGSTGGPVLNWRTGSVCGLLLVTADTGLWLVPAAMLGPHGPPAPAWLALMDDGQLRASGQQYPNAVLRTYLADVQQLGEGHPYRPMVRQGPSLTAFYLPQHLYHESDGAHRITVEALAGRHEGAQVLGDPGVGKSSLVRHLAADSAAGWLAGQQGTFVPIPLSARALATSGPLPRLLADGVIREITTVLDTPALVTLFEREPMPGVPWLVLVDGLDEVLNEFDRRMVLDRVLGHRELYRFLVTSRPLGDGTFDRLAQRYPTYVVEPFDDEELARFARAWFTDARRHDVDGMVTKFMAEVARSGLGRLARVPLVAMMLCIVFTGDAGDGLPRNQYQVYERFFAVLAKKMEASGAREEFRRHVSAYGAAAEEAVARLLTDVPALLEDIACAQQGLTEVPDNRPILAQAIDRSRPGRPATIPADTWAELVAEALRASGLLVHRQADFRFLHQTIGEYLAAKRLAASEDPRSFLTPQDQWPWRHLEIKIFVVALWTARGVGLGAQFGRLLRGSRRDANVGFLVELGRRGIPLPRHIHVRVGDILAARIHSDRTMARDWLEAVRWLGDLDPSRVIDELALLVRRDPAGDRVFDAVTELMTLDAGRGTAVAAAVIEREVHSPVKRLSLAERVLAVDRKAGIEALKTLARSRTMGTLAVASATRVVDEDLSQGVALLGWIVETQWSTVDALAACQALLRYGQDGVAELDRIGQLGFIHDRSQLALANEIAKIDKEAAVRRYNDLANRRSDVRFAAAQALTRLNAELGVRALQGLVSDVTVPPAVRIEAASYLAADLSQGNDELAAIAGDIAKVPTADRIEAARLLARSDPMRGADVLADLAEADGGQPQVLDLIAELAEEANATTMIRFVCNPKASPEKRAEVAARLDALGHRAELVAALAEIAGATATPMPDRLMAATLVANVDPVQGRTALSGIAADKRLFGSARIAAADRVRAINEPSALALYLAIATNSRDVEPRIEAARKAGEIDASEGIWALVDLSHFVVVDQYDDVAAAAFAVDPEMAVRRWSQLPKGARDAMQRVQRRAK